MMMAVIRPSLGRLSFVLFPFKSELEVQKSRECRRNAAEYQSTHAIVTKGIATEVQEPLTDLCAPSSLAIVI